MVKKLVITNSAFSKSLSLTEISFEFPSSVTAISNYAFKSCSLLVKITIPSFVTAIGDFAFQVCSSLTHKILK